MTRREQDITQKPPTIPKEDNVKKANVRVGKLNEEPEEANERFLIGVIIFFPFLATLEIVG